MDCFIRTCRLLSLLRVTVLPRLYNSTNESLTTIGESSPVHVVLDQSVV